MTSTDGAPAASAPPDEEQPRRRAEEQLPGQARLVVVPVANPSTAGELLRLAVALTGESGRVQAVSVLLDDASAEAARDDAASLEGEVLAVAETFPDREVELVQRPATTIARGILESARDDGADLLLLGAPPVGTDGPLLGAVAESVVEVAPCDVLVVRPGEVDAGSVRRVLVAVDEDPSCRAAARTGTVLGDGLDVPVEVVHVQPRGRPRLEGHGVLANALDGVQGSENVRRRLLTGSETAGGLVHHANGDDLLVIGLQRQDQLRRWLFGSVVGDLLRRVEGPVLVVARQTSRPGVQGRLQQLVRKVRPGLTEAEEETLVWQGRRQAGLSIDYVTLLVLSAVLSTLGLVQDSTAVIIGAMLVAPLLGPLSAASMGITTARTQLLRRALLSLLVGSLAALGVAVLVGLLLPLPAPTAQMTLRGSPTLLDVGIAAASGLVGAYATARKDIPAALAGVAIAAALVPPICVVGLGVALGDSSLATGALVLYLTNIAAVLATGAAAFWWFGLHPPDQDAATRRRLVTAALGVGLALVTVVTVVGMLQVSRTEEIAVADVESDLARLAGVDLESVELTDEGGTLVVTAELRSERDVAVEELAEAEASLTQRLGRPVELRAVVQRLVVP